MVRVRRFALIAFGLTLFCSAEAQLRFGRLVIQSNQIFDLEQSDILVADTLILMDSARIRLNQLRPDNFIRVKFALIGKGCVIDGRGMDGASGRKGRDGEASIGPCRDGVSGTDGGNGLTGRSGVNLYLYFEELAITDNLVIDLSGGNGGKGGDGGNGGGGNPGTIHCKGGNGGAGGKGGNGGDGGRGGRLYIECTRCNDIRSLFSERVVFRSTGGSYGNGGFGGYAGPPGLAPNKNNGKKGLAGLEGTKGVSGQNGGLNFDIK